MTVRSQGRVELCRLELAGLAPVEEGRRAQGAPGRAGGVRARGRLGSLAVGARRMPLPDLQRQEAVPRVVERPAGNGQERPVVAGRAKRQSQHAERRAVANHGCRGAATESDRRSCRRSRPRTIGSPGQARTARSRDRAPRGRRRLSRARGDPRTARRRRRSRGAPS